MVVVVESGSDSGRSGVGNGACGGSNRDGRDSGVGSGSTSGSSSDGGDGGFVNCPNFTPGWIEHCESVCFTMAVGF